MGASVMDWKSCHDLAHKYFDLAEFHRDKAVVLMGLGKLREADKALAESKDWRIRGSEQIKMSQAVT